MSWLSNLVEGKRVIREWDDLEKNLYKGMAYTMGGTDVGAHWMREFRRNVEMPWKSGYKIGNEGFGPLGNPVLGATAGLFRVATDWLFQNTGPGSGSPSWSDVPGSEDVMSAEEIANTHGTDDTDTTASDLDDKDGDGNGNGNGNGNGDGDGDATGGEGDLDTPAASQALAALMRRRMKMRRGRSSTVLTKGAKIGKGDKKTMAYA